MGRSFFTPLDIVYLINHLNVKYYNIYDQLVTIQTRLSGDHSVCETLQKDPTMTTMNQERIARRTFVPNLSMPNIYTIKFDEHLEETTTNDKREFRTKSRVKNQDYFKMEKMVKKGASLHALVKKDLIKLFKANVFLFTIYLDEMPSIDPTWLSIISILIPSSNMWPKEEGNNCLTSLRPLGALFKLFYKQTFLS